MAASAKITDNQKGKKSTETKIITDAKILKTIILYYTLSLKLQSIRKFYSKYNAK